MGIQDPRGGDGQFRYVVALMTLKMMAIIVIL